MKKNCEIYIFTINMKIIAQNVHEKLFKDFRIKIVQKKMFIIQIKKSFRNKCLFLEKRIAQVNYFFKK